MKNLYFYRYVNKSSKMSKEVRFFLDAYGKEGGELQTLVLTDKMLPPEIKSTFRKVAMANVNDNLQLILSQQNQQKHIPFEYDELSAQVEYRLVVTRLRAGKMCLLLYKNITHYLCPTLK